MDMRDKELSPSSFGEGVVADDTITNLSNESSDNISNMKDVLYEVRCLKSNEDMILALTGQFKQLSHEPEKFR